MNRFQVETVVLNRLVQYGKFLYKNE